MAILRRKCKLTNSDYGAFMTREEVEEAIEKSNVILTLAIRSVVDIDFDNNYFLKLWDDE